MIYSIQKGYDVEINIPEYPIFVRIDKKAAIRIIKNIIDNAIKYGDDGKYLGITVEEKGKRSLCFIRGSWSGD